MLYLFLVLFLLLFVTSSLPLKWPKEHIHPSRLSIYYGGPGSGKTTFCAWLTRKATLSGINVYSNVPIHGAFIINKADIGCYCIPPGILMIDEAGVEYNNRDFGSSFSKKSGGEKALEWYKKHRHEGVEVIIFSQGFDDMDLKLRTLASDMYIVRKSIIPGFIVRRRISKLPKIDKDTHQPIDSYDYVPFGRKYILARSVWKYFDSFDKMGLPEKSWSKYGEKEPEFTMPSFQPPTTL